MKKQNVVFRELGLQDYKTVWDYQESLLQQSVKVKSAISNLQFVDIGETDEIQDLQLSTVNYLLFVEHPPVYTLGKSGDIKNLLIDEDEMEKRSIGFYKTNRGGDITFHGPGQIVGYPVLDLEKFTTDIGKYLRNLEEAIILTLADYGINGERSPGETGVWIDSTVKGKERKICAIGVRCSRWITMHGFAFNINTDLSYFDYIVPCGIENKKVTSLEKELGRKINFEEAKARVKRNFEKVFDVVLTGDETE